MSPRWPVYRHKPKDLERMIHIMSSTIQSKIVSELNKCGIFGLISDETTDCSRLEQILVCVRYVNEEVKV